MSIRFGGTRKIISKLGIVTFIFSDGGEESASLRGVFLMLYLILLAAADQLNGD